MTPPAAGTSAILRAEARVLVRAEPGTVYDTVSDLPRSGERSRERTGGRRVSGTPRRVGAAGRGGAA
ncbi:hypothetical protein ACSNOH_34915 [Streptomyces sp. URMC 127]|uniref:hypothetical protein n=1 Tax=Streptomyces sp. URMC 127 TaxID=3423402 RepID=UPI003F1C9395